MENGRLFWALSHPSPKLGLAQAQFHDSRFHKRTTFIRFLFVWDLKAGIQQGARNRWRAVTGPRSSCRGYRIRLCSLEGFQGSKWRDKEPLLGISVHIPVLLTLPQRAIIDSDTRLLYNKAYNWAFFFFESKGNKHSVGLFFPCTVVQTHRKGEQW